ISRDTPGCLFINMSRALPYPWNQQQSLVNAWSSSGTYQPGDLVTNAGHTYVNFTGTNTATAPGSDTTNWKQITDGTIADGPGTFYVSDRNCLSDDGIHLNIIGRRTWATVFWGLLCEAAAARRVWTRVPRARGALLR